MDWRTFELSDFSLGLDNTPGRPATDPRSLVDATNVHITSTKSLETRAGIAKLNASAIAAAAVRSLWEFPSGGVNYVLGLAGTVLKGLVSASWVSVLTGLDATARMNFVNHRGYCYAVDGVDAGKKIRASGGSLVASDLGITPPAAAPAAVAGASTGLTGKYQYKYTYIRDTPDLQFSNPSPASVELTLTNEDGKVSVVASTDAQVTNIRLYRTLELGTTPASSYYLQGEYANAAADILDTTADDGLGAIMEEDNDLPPLARLVAVHKDNVFYADCPNEADGHDLVRWSKRGQGESCPVLNYQYVKRGDGKRITGIASCGDLFLIFKRDSIAVLEGEFQNLYYLPGGIGAMDQSVIIPMGDKIVFLSEEGWKATDGRDVYDITGRASGWVEEGYTAYEQRESYSAAYLPAKKQLRFLLRHSGLDDLVAVGHFLVPLLYIDKGIGEKSSENIVSWTQYLYSNHSLTCLAQYTDALGITRLMAGDSSGYVYAMDSGTDDDGSDIAWAVSTAYVPFDVPEDTEKVVRRLNFVYTSVAEEDIAVELRRDYIPTGTEQTLTGADATYVGSAYAGYAYCGLDGNLVERVKVAERGRVFQVNVSGAATHGHQIHKIIFNYRPIPQR